MISYEIVMTQLNRVKARLPGGLKNVIFCGSLSPNDNEKI